MIFTKKRQTCFTIIFLIIASCAAFGGIAGNDFINFDDPTYITDNNHIKSGINTESIKWAFTSVVMGNWHPLTMLSHMLDWSLFGANPTGHHLVNLLLHIGAVIFLFLFLNKATNNIWPSAFAAALFAWHPLRVESVAWAAERKDVLSMFFAMACLWTYAFWAESNKKSQYFLCLLLFALSLLSKSMMVTLPFVLILLDYWPLKRPQKSLAATDNRSNSIGRLILEKVPFICLTVTFSIIALWVQNKGGSLVFNKIIPFSGRIMNAVVSYVAYLGKIFYPVNLAIYYTYNLSLPLWKVLISGMILIMITLAVLYYMKKLPFLFVGWFWYLGTAIPVIGLIQTGAQALSDRYTYLPSIGIMIMLSWSIQFLFPRRETFKRVLFPAGSVVLIVLGVLTWRQCGYWKNSISIFSQALRTTENNHLAYYQLGSAFVGKGKITQAIDYYNRAIDIVQDFQCYYLGRANAYASIGENQKAFNDYDKAILLSPDYTSAYYNRGTLYAKMEKYELAIEDLNKVISLDRDHIKAYNNRGIVLDRLGLYQKAINDFNEAIRLKPDYAHAWSNRALSHLKLGDKISGCRDAEKSCELKNCNMLKWAQIQGYCQKI